MEKVTITLEMPRKDQWASLPWLGSPMVTQGGESSRTQARGSFSIGCCWDFRWTLSEPLLKCDLLMGAQPLPFALLSACPFQNLGGSPVPNLRENNQIIVIITKGTLRAPGVAQLVKHPPSAQVMIL